jgi:hypothetical protein
MSYPVSDSLRLSLLLLLTLGSACKPKIGDECSTSAECNISAPDRICLTEAAQGLPGGYCTSFNCGPTDCPDEALCVAYRSTLGNAPECSTEITPRLQRSYCMFRCDTTSDCRDGYACVNVAAEDNPWGARILNSSSGSGKVCALAYTDPKTDTKRRADVCESVIEPPAATGAPSSSEASETATATSPAVSETATVSSSSSPTDPAPVSSAAPTASNVSSTLADAGVSDSGLTP